MIILDTTVFLELMKPAPTPAVIGWIDRQSSTQLYVTTTTIAEISDAIWIQPDSRRRQAVNEAFHKVVAEGFAHRICPFPRRP